MIYFILGFGACVVLECLILVALSIAQIIQKRKK